MDFTKSRLFKNYAIAGTAIYHTLWKAMPSNLNPAQRPLTMQTAVASGVLQVAVPW